MIEDPMPARWFPECDWGGCDEETVAMRYAGEGLWLAVCQKHATERGAISHLIPEEGDACCETCGGDGVARFDFPAAGTSWSGTCPTCQGSGVLQFTPTPTGEHER